MKFFLFCGLLSFLSAAESIGNVSVIAHCNKIEVLRDFPDGEIWRIIDDSFYEDISEFERRYIYDEKRSYLITRDDGFVEYFWSTLLGSAVLSFVGDEPGRFFGSDRLFFTIFNQGKPGTHIFAKRSLILGIHGRTTVISQFFIYDYDERYPGRQRLELKDNSSGEILYSYQWNPDVGSLGREDNEMVVQDYLITVRKRRYDWSLSFTPLKAEATIEIIIKKTHDFFGGYVYEHNTSQGFTFIKKITGGDFPDPYREYWGGYRIDSDYWVETGEWMDRLYIANFPYVWSNKLKTWLYIDERNLQENGGWVYILR